MFDHIFENRDKKVTNLIRLGDCLGRSLRENVILFSIDDRNSRVSYLTESEKVITGEFDVKDGVTLDFIVVEDFDVYTNQEKFDHFVDSKVSLFIESLYSDDYRSAQLNFSDILGTWNSRLKFDEVKTKLHEKKTRFNDTQDILSSQEFHNFLEISEQLGSFLEEHAEKIINVPEIINGIRLSETVSRAFNLPRLNYESLAKVGTYRLTDLENKSIYEMICRQELVKKELLESKNQFKSSWASNPSVRALAGLIYEESDEKISNALSEVIDQVPYFAFVSKKDIFESIRNALSISESVSIPEEHIRRFTSKIFEFKKPVKSELIKVLNEKYGINIQNLKEVPSFKSLANTQVVVLESLSRISPKGSVQKQVLKEFAKLMQEKSGVQTLDINDCLRLIFESAGFGELFEDGELINYWDGDLSTDVESELVGDQFVEYDESEDPINEEEEVEDQEMEEEEEDPQEPDPMEEDPEEDEEDKEDSAKKAEDTPDESTEEDFYEAMKSLEDILGDLDTQSPPEEESENQ
jgi:hypothetical protein